MSKTFYKGYKYKIYPTEDQAKKLDRFITLSRNVYNWGIAKEEELYEQYQNGNSEYGFYTWYELIDVFEIERNLPENKWMFELPNTTARNALKNVVQAFKNFFSKRTNYPRFKSKKHSKETFNTRKERFNIKNNSIKIEGIKTRIDLGFDSGFDLDKVTNPTISKDNLGNYYVSFSLEEESKNLETSKSEGIGIDLGVRRTYTLDSGEIYSLPKEKLDKLKRRKSKLQRHVTRDIKSRMKEAERTKTKYEDIPKSKRSEKRLNRLRKIDRKIHNIKDTFYNTITKQIVMRNPEYVCMETFSVSEIGKKSKYMYKLLWDISFYDITHKMQCKCEEYNIPFIKAPIEFPSTKMCSNCGSIKNMHGKHAYICPVCGMREDRDINAAINLRNYGSQFIN